MKISEALEKGAAFLETHKWTKHFMARDAKDQSVSPKSKKAVCFCAMGAIVAATSKKTQEKVLDWDSFYPGNRPELADVNDCSSSKQEIIHYMRRLAKQARAEGK